MPDRFLARAPRGTAATPARPLAAIAALRVRRAGVAAPVACLLGLALAGCATPAAEEATVTVAASSGVPAPEEGPRWRCDRPLGSAVLLPSGAEPREDGLDPTLAARALRPLLAASGCFSTLSESLEGGAPPRADFQLRAGWRLVPREGGAGSLIGGGTLGPAGAWAGARREAVLAELSLVDGRSAKLLAAATAPRVDAGEGSASAAQAQAVAAWGDAPPSTARERELGRALAAAWQELLPAAREQHAQWRAAAARAAAAAAPAPAPVGAAPAPAAPAAPVAKPAPRAPGRPAAKPGPAPVNPKAAPPTGGAPAPASMAAPKPAVPAAAAQAAGPAASAPARRP